MEPLTVLQVVTLSERGGAQRHVADLTKGLLLRGHRVHVAAGGSGPLIGEVSRVGAEVHPQPHMVRDISPARDAAALRDLLRLIRRTRPDVVHAHSSKAGLLARVAARLRGVPSVYTAHGFVFLEPLARGRAASYRWIERVGAMCGNRLITVSARDARAAVAQRVARPGEVVVIPNGLDPPGDPSVAPPPFPFRFAAIANAYPTKGLDVLIEAVRRLGALGLSDVEVLVAGDGPERGSLIERARGLPVRFLGEISDVDDLLSSVQASVLPSRKEGWPYAVLESMAAARPVIATDVGGIAEQLDGDRCGWLVPSGDAVALANAMVEAASRPDECTVRGARGYERLRSRFTASEMVDRIEREYRSLLAANDRRPSGRN